ncbi:MAG TPA: alpha/beta hydrolase [Burkholderiaceae bacterium]|nr:alpha/beta hydrolase [Burkholderiaceae bacterium]
MLTRARRIVLMALFGMSPLTLAGCIERFFFYPDSSRYASPEQFGLKVEDVRLTATDGTKLHAWFLPAGGTAKGTVLHLHGNAANVSNHLPLVAWMPTRGYNVLMLDYRGFGKSEGKPTLDGIVEDAMAALGHLRTRADVDRDRLVVFGQSLGGATALRMLARDSTGVRLAIIDSSFPSYRGIARDATAGSAMAPLASLAASALPPAGKDPVTALKSIRVPLIFMHGTRDSVIPHANSDALHAAAPDSRLWKIPDAEHIAAFAFPGPWREKLVAAMDAAVR